MLIPFAELCNRYAIRPKGVVHCGAHHAEERDDYARGGVERVIWIEAMPDAFVKTVKNTTSINTTGADKIVASNGIVCLQACLSDVDGEHVKFNVASNGQSSSMLEFGTHTTAHPEVKFVGTLDLITTRFDTLMQWHGLVGDLKPGGFLNVDTQGSELLVLKGMGDLLKQFDYAYVEVNAKELYVGNPLIKDVDDYLALFGFQPIQTQMTNFGWGDRFYMKTH